MTTIEDDVLADSLPESITFDPQVVTIANVSDQQKNIILPIIDQIRVLCNIQALPEYALDLLAFQYQTLFYTGTFTITDPVARLLAKQKLVGSSWDFHTRLGVPATMQNIITTIYQNASIQEWFAYGGAANHFRILTDNVINDTGVIANITQTIQLTKRASQAFDGFFTRNTAGPTNVYVSAAVYTQIWQTLPMAVVNTKLNVLAPKARLSLNAKNVIAPQCALVMGASVVADPYSKAKLAPHASLTGTPKLARGLAIGIGRKATLVATGKVTHKATVTAGKGIKIVGVNAGGH